MARMRQPRSLREPRSRRRRWWWWWWWKEWKLALSHHTGRIQSEVGGERGPGVGRERRTLLQNRRGHCRPKKVGDEVRGRGRVKTRDVVPRRWVACTEFLEVQALNEIYAGKNPSKVEPCASRRGEFRRRANPFGGWRRMGSLACLNKRAQKSGEEVNPRDLGCESGYTPLRRLVW